MTTRRSRPSRSRKSQTPSPEPRRDDVLAETTGVATVYPSDVPAMPPSITDELALLDAGWDSV